MPAKDPNSDERLPVPRSQDAEREEPLIVRERIAEPVVTREKKRSSSTRSLLFRPLGWVLAGTVLVVLISTFGRSYFDSLFTRLDWQKTVHPDSSEISAQSPQVKPSLVIVYREQDGELRRAVADAERFAAFTRQQMETLLRYEEKLAESIEDRLATATQPVFNDMRNGVAVFADWYFSWLTTYRVLGVAIGSAGSHLFAVEAMSLRDSVAADVAEYIKQYYEETVLQPEINDPRLEQAYHGVLGDLHKDYLRVLVGFNEEFQRFVAAETTHLDPDIQTDAARVELDWDSHFHKLSLSQYEKGGLEALRGAGLAAAGAAGGKAAGAVAGKATATAVSGKAVGAAAGKTLMAKLSAPFAAKAASAAAAASAGGVSGALGGPLGAFVGAGIGLGVDYMVNEGVELATRDDFEADTLRTVAATRQEWQAVMKQALRKNIRVWFSDTLELVAQYGQ